MHVTLKAGVNGTEVSENRDVLRLRSFPENIWNSVVPFVSRNFRKFKPEFSKNGNNFQKRQVSGANLPLTCNADREQ